MDMASSHEPHGLRSAGLDELGIVPCDEADGVALVGPARELENHGDGLVVPHGRTFLRVAGGLKPRPSFRHMRNARRFPGRVGQVVGFAYTGQARDHQTCTYASE